MIKLGGKCEGGAEIGDTTYKSFPRFTSYGAGPKEMILIRLMRTLLIFFMNASLTE